MLAETVEGIPPVYADDTLFDMFSPQIAELLRKKGVTRLYQHQADAVSEGMSGANVALQAPTASGKTFAFQIPLMERLMREGGHALMIYPTKALPTTSGINSCACLETYAPTNRQSSPGGTTEMWSRKSDRLWIGRPLL